MPMWILDQRKVFRYVCNTDPNNKLGHFKVLSVKKCYFSKMTYANCLFGDLNSAIIANQKIIQKIPTVCLY